MVTAGVGAADMKAALRSGTWPRQKSTMRAMVLDAPGRPLRLEKRPIPEPGPQQLLLRVEACAFTPYATCPLPPRQNRLPIRVEAGEKRYGEH